MLCVCSKRAYEQLKMFTTTMFTQVNIRHILAQETMDSGTHWMFLPAGSLKNPQVGAAELAPSAQVTPVWPPVLMSACKGQSYLGETVG